MEVIPSKRIKADSSLSVASPSPSLLPRTSSLSSPIMLLSGGHAGEIFTVQFDPSGNYIASGSFDKTINIWNVYGECGSLGLLKGHSGAILDLKWTTDGSMIVSGSSDKSLILWEPETCTQVKKYHAHADIINAVDVNTSTGNHCMATASNDRKVKIWDSRYRRWSHELRHQFPITAVAFDKNSNSIYTGGIDGYIYAWDLRGTENTLLYTLEGHSDIITSISIHPNMPQILSNSMDNHLRIWDIQASPTYSERCLKIFEGSVISGFEKNLIKSTWSSNGQLIASGSADRCVYVWEAATRKLIYQLPGHKGIVNQVHFSPKEPILASAGSDKQIFLGEIEY